MGKWTKICEDIELALAFDLSPVWGDNEEWENVMETFVRLIYLRVEKLWPGMEDEIFEMHQGEWLKKVGNLAGVQFDGDSNAVDTIRAIYRSLNKMVEEKAHSNASSSL